MATPDYDLARQRAARRDLEKRLDVERARCLELTTTVHQMHRERFELRALLRDALTRRSLEKQTVPDVIFAIEHYIGGQTESRLDRQRRSHAMIKTCLVVREAITRLFDDEVSEDV